MRNAVNTVALRNAADHANKDEERERERTREKKILMTRQIQLCEIQAEIRTRFRSHHVKGLITSNWHSTAVLPLLSISVQA